MARRKRMINRSQSIDDFPLPPGVLGLKSSNHKLGEKTSVPELNRNYQFPGVSGDENHSIKKAEDPGSTYMRLLCETDMLAIQWANDPTSLQLSKTHSRPSLPSAHHQYQQNTLNNNLDHSDKTKNLLNPENLSHENVIPPAFPFQEFAGWNLKSEGDHTIDEYNGEDVILPHNEPSPASTSPPPSLRSFHLGRLKRKNHFMLPKRDIPMLEHAAYAHSFLLTQNRARKEQELESQTPIQHEKILRETREAVLSISEAGFDFGFGKHDSGALSLARSPHRQSKSPSNQTISTPNSQALHGNDDSSINHPGQATEEAETEALLKVANNQSTTIKRSVLTLPQRDSHRITTPPDTQESSSIIWSSQPQNYNLSEFQLNSRHNIIGNLKDDLVSPPSTPKRVPRQFLTMSDLSDVLNLNRPSRQNSPSSASPPSRSIHDDSMDRKCSDSSCSATLELTSSDHYHMSDQSSPTTHTGSDSLDMSRNHDNYINVSCAIPPQPHQFMFEKPEQRKPPHSAGLWLKVKTSMTFSRKKSHPVLPSCSS